MCMMDKCYIQNLIEEEDTVVEEEADLAKADTIKSVTPTNGKRTGTIL